MTVKLLGLLIGLLKVNWVVSDYLLIYLLSNLTKPGGRDQDCPYCRDKLLKLVEIVLSVKTCISLSIPCLIKYVTKVVT